MAIDFKKYDALVADAVSHYWRTLKKQAEKQSSGDADRGARAAVTGGAQMNGFCHVVCELLKDQGLSETEILLESKLDLPGYFRPTKNWDMLVIADGQFLAALEFKSQAGSFGNNFNNRSEEAIGSAQDLRTAYHNGAFGRNNAKPPWLGWIMLLKDCEGSRVPVKVSEPHFKVFPEFKGASYAKRYEILISKLVHEGLYDAGALLLSTDSEGLKGKYHEPADKITMRTFLAGLAGHVGVHMASRSKRK